MKNKSPKPGDLKVWHIPQVPMVPFYVPVSSVEEAVKVMRILADYDLFQESITSNPTILIAKGLFGGKMANG